MANLNPYLNFDGQCHEAMAFYQQCLGGELNFQRISDSPIAVHTPAHMLSKILHSTLTSGHVVLMGSDMSSEKTIRGNAISLCINCTQEKQIDLFFDKLSQGGVVITPLHQSFWGATYGELVDKYGIRWLLNYSKIS
jgi:PhnB protein